MLSCTVFWARGFEKKLNVGREPKNSYEGRVLTLVLIRRYKSDIADAGQAREPKRVSIFSLLLKYLLSRQNSSKAMRISLTG